MKYTKEILADAVAVSSSFAGVLRYLGLIQSGGTQCHVKKRIEFYDIDFSHFTGKLWSKGKVLERLRLKASDILVLSDKDRRSTASQLKRALLEIGRMYICEGCGVESTYNDAPITLQIDHINGDWTNNLETNLRFMCPNCHSQTPNYGRRKDSKPKVPKIIRSRQPKIKIKVPRPRKFDVDADELHKLVWSMPTTKVALMFGVSDNAVAKRCKLLSIDKPPRGYWAKQAKEN
jgi:hypothetical protein